MAEIVEFGQAGMSKKKYKNKILYPPRDGQSITIRFVGCQQKIYCKWEHENRRFIFAENKDGEEYIPRIISFVIDKEDNKVKAFVCPISIFQQMGEKSEYGIDHDFKINRTGRGLETIYKVECLEKTIVSDELKHQIDITSKEYPLPDIFIKNIKWELLEVEAKPIKNRFDILDL